MMTEQKSTGQDIRHMDEIYGIYDPWLWASMDRSEFTVTLPSGLAYRIYIPLDAAVEIETAGYDIKLTGQLAG